MQPQIDMGQLTAEEHNQLLEQQRVANNYNQQAYNQTQDFGYGDQNWKGFRKFFHFFFFR